MEYNNDRLKYFAIISSDDVDLIDYSEVIENDENSLRYSLDGTKTFVKWLGVSNPSFLENIENEQILNYESMIELLATTEWSGEE